MKNISRTDIQLTLFADDDNALAQGIIHIPLIMKPNDHKFVNVFDI